MMDPAFVTVSIALIGVFGAILVARSTNRKADREGADSIASAAVQLIEPLENRLEKVIDENNELRTRLGALESEAREVETLRFENQHLRERVNYLEVQVEMLTASSNGNDDLEEKLAFERARSGTLAKAVGALTGQIIGLGGEPIVDLGDEHVE